MAGKVNEVEITAVKGVAGAKAGLVLGAQLELLKSKFLAIPVLAGGAIAAFLTGKKTDRRVKKVLNVIKEAEVDKATYVFEKMAIGPMGIGTIALIGGHLGPKPRSTATSVATPAGKNIKMKKLVNLPKTGWRVKKDKTKI